MANFFGGSFFGGGFFGATEEAPAAVVADAPLVGGKGDNSDRARRVFKPTGLAPRQKPRTRLEERVEERVAETAEIHREVAAKTKALIAPPPFTDSDMREVDAAIAKQLQTERDQEDELIIALLVAVAQDD